MKLKDFDRFVNISVNQIYFINEENEWEYHPEREEFLGDYFFVRYIIEKIDDTNDFQFDTDIFDLGFSAFEELYKKMNEFLKTYDKNESKEYLAYRQAVNKKVEYLKNLTLKRNNFSMADVAIAEFVEKINIFLENEGLAKCIEAMSKAGENYDKELSTIKSKNGGSSGKTDE